MKLFLLRKTSATLQYLSGILLISLVSACSYLLSDYMGYHVVALVLLVAVSLIAMFYDILPVLICALLSALIWNYFFIPPKFTLRIGSAEDLLMFLMYFVVATLNAVLTFKIRQIEKESLQKEEKEHTLKLYNTMLSSLSHELRTPIATIVGATDNLENKELQLSEMHRAELMSSISAAAFRLNQQVENLLNMSRLESGHIRLKRDWVDISELVYSVVKRVEQNRISQEIRININPDIPFFKVDKVMIEQVLYNLLNNATLYTPPESKIDIIASCHIDMLQLIIEDSGNGFPEDETEKVFDKFYRLNHTKGGGTGLGLSIARGFVEAHNGSIILKNKPEGGARFIIDIPAETTYISNLKNE